MIRSSVLALVAALACGVLGCLPPLASLGHVIPATSPYPWATHLADYKKGNWVRYRLESAGSAIETWIAVVGESGGNLWIHVGTSLGTFEYDHVLCVEPSVRKVVKAYYSDTVFHQRGKDKVWWSCDIKVSPAAQTGDACPMCGKAHKAPDVNVSEARVRVGDKDLPCKKADVTAHLCDGKEARTTSFFSNEVPRLFDLSGLSEHGGLVRFEGSGVKITLVGFGTNGLPMHDFPWE